MDEPSDSEEEELLTQEQKSSESRRAQNAKFESWFTSRAETLITADGKPIVDDESALDETQTAAYLIGKHESKVIISGAREYQIELFERAKAQNTIAVLPTGAGKTLIAVLLLKHILDQELEDRALGKAHRGAFFLVDSTTLVFQQFAVLECNLDQKIDRFCGDMGFDLWSKEVWQKRFAENMAIVCTPEVLKDSLSHGFITIAQINILIFDEAHHTKKNHAYARIIKDFYLAEPDLEKRPRIFGMTASPVDAKVDVVKAAKDLETLLHCQIATTSRPSLLQKTINRPEELIAVYDTLSPTFETPLYEVMNDRFGLLVMLERPFSIALEASAELGSWCADQIWAFIFADSEDRRLESKMERDFLAQNPQSEPLETLDKNVALLQEAREVIRKHTFREPRPDPADLSSKVLALHNYLLQVFERPSDSKAIVFVQTRHTARMLEALFSRPSMTTANMRVGVLVGNQKGKAWDRNISFRQQVLTLMRFRRGHINCLFATSIAEEGLDIPDCNVVIRFDLYTTMIQYIQSRGRARHRNSKYVHMIEKDNIAHLECVRTVQSSEEDMNRFCAALPQDRLLQGNDGDLEDLIAKEKYYRVFTEPETGAKLTYQSSLAVLAHFVSCLQHDPDVILQPDYIMSSCDGAFVCEVLLPENSPLRSARGRVAPRKAVAKRSAAFEACLSLRKMRFLDEHLLPIYQKQLPAMRNALLALTMKGAKEYDMRSKPSLWANDVGFEPAELFMTLVELAEPAGLGPHYQPLALLTRRPLPRLPDFPIFFEFGSNSQVILTTSSARLKMTEGTLARINSFTLRFFEDLFNKVYESDTKRMPYWLVPVVGSSERSLVDNHPTDLVDWSALEEVHKQPGLHFDENTPDEFFLDRFLVDPLDGGIRYFTVRINEDLKPTDPVPIGVPPRRQRRTILQYSNSYWKNTRDKIQWRETQPVIEVKLVRHRRTWLDESSATQTPVKSICFVCPDALKVSALSTGIAALGYLFPAIMYRLDSYLIALEFSHTLSLDLEPAYALEALTKDSDHTEEHRTLQMHFNRGMGRNYERLEFLGDCFLKMATSISLFTQNPDNDEFQYHVKRMLLVCNKNLLKTALTRKFYEYIRSQSFQRRSWYPEEPTLLSGKSVERGMRSHRLADKTIADVCEAIIGAAYLSPPSPSSTSCHRFDPAVRAVTEVVSSPDHDMTTWSAYYALYRLPSFQLAPATRSQLDLVEQIATKDGYTFGFPRLLRSAFIHPSYPYIWEKIPCYQRLEFLGDSLLDMACVDFLFHRFPDRDPQWLTEHKMAMVSNRFLGALCVNLGFHKHLRCNSTIVALQIRAYVTEIEEAELASDGAKDYWLSVRQPPKALPDIMEAYLGALFVDSHFSYHQITRFFTTHIQPFFEDMTIYDTFANNHPITRLTTLLTTSLGCIQSRTLCSELPGLPGPGTSSGSEKAFLAAVMIHHEIVAEGRANSVRQARVRASEVAAQLLAGLTPSEFRSRWGCDCVGVAPEMKVDIDPTEREGEDVVMKDDNRAAESRHISDGG